MHALVLLSALLPILLPYTWMNAIHESLGLGVLPKAPIVEYLTRSLSLVYALHGAVCLALAMDVIKYLSLIRLVAVFHMGFGAIVLGIDLISKMPWYWTIGEGPMIIAFAIFVYSFSASLQKHEAAQDSA